MKKLFLTWSAASLLALFNTACGDDVIHVHNDVYAIVDSLDSLDCNSENEGKLALVKSTDVLYTCTDGEWSVVNASEAVDLRCKSEALKDSTGYKIICDGEIIGTVQNGTDGQDGHPSRLHRLHLEEGCRRQDWPGRQGSQRGQRFQGYLQEGDRRSD